MVLAILLYVILKKVKAVRQSYRGTPVSHFFDLMLSKLQRRDPTSPGLPTKGRLGATTAGPGQKCHLLLASSAAFRVPPLAGARWQLRGFSKHRPTRRYSIHMGFWMLPGMAALL